MDSYGRTGRMLATFIMERLMTEPNTVADRRTCKCCGSWTVVVWYTKRGRQNIQCVKCGKVWDIYDKGNEES